MPSLVRNKNSDDHRFPCFERSAGPCPTSNFSAYVKQVNPSELSASERGFLDASFGGFLTGVSTPGAATAMLAARFPNVSHENRIPRRYDGDRTLPRGRYYTVCEDAEGRDSGTLGYELKFYKRARTAKGHIEVFDPGVTSEREMIGLLGFATSADERIVVRFTPFAQQSDVTTPVSINLSIPIKIEKLQVDNVLDLRRPAALNWVFQTLPNLHVLGDGEKWPCFPFRNKLATFGDILPSFMDQAQGGGNFDKIVGLYLRQIGISGLVFPSVRNDAYTYAVNGEPKEFHGWSFVDYREAPQPEQVVIPRAPSGVAPCAHTRRRRR
jgi:hypothetical protein